MEHLEEEAKQILEAGCQVEEAAFWEEVVWLLGVEACEGVVALMAGQVLEAFVHPYQLQVQVQQVPEELIPLVTSLLLALELLDLKVAQLAN